MNSRLPSGAAEVGTVLHEYAHYLDGEFYSPYQALPHLAFVNTQGMEYDTDLQREVESGCNDVPGYQQSQPGYISCSEDYVWNAELKIK